MPPDSPLWYYAQDQHRFGPVSLEDLIGLVSTHRLRPDDLVWSAGMTEWAAAHTVAELAAAAAEDAAVPPPLPGAHQPQRHSHSFSTTGAYFAPQGMPLNSQEKGRRIFLIAASGLAVTSLFMPSFLLHYDTNASFSAIPQAYQQLAPQAYQQMLQSFNTAATGYLPHVLWGFDMWWVILIFLCGLVGLTAAILDLAMQSNPLIRSITRWTHWSTYAAIVLLAFVGLVYSYESGRAYLKNYVIGIPISPLLLLGFGIAALIVSIRIYQGDTSPEEAW